MVNINKLRAELGKIQTEKEIELKTNLSAGKTVENKSNYSAYTMFLTKGFWEEMKTVAASQNITMSKLCIEALILYKSVLTNDIDIATFYDGPLTATPLSQTQLSVEKLSYDIGKIKEDLFRLSNHFGVPVQSSDR